MSQYNVSPETIAEGAKEIEKRMIEIANSGHIVKKLKGVEHETWVNGDTLTLCYNVGVKVKFEKDWNGKVVLVHVKDGRNNDKPSTRISDFLHGFDRDGMQEEKIESQLNSS